MGIENGGEGNGLLRVGREQKASGRCENITGRHGAGCVLRGEEGILLIQKEG